MEKTAQSVYNHIREWVGDYFKRVKESLQDSSSQYETVCFNGVFVVVGRDSDVDDLLVIYNMQRAINNFYGE